MARIERTAGETVGQKVATCPFTNNVHHSLSLSSLILYLIFDWSYVLDSILVNFSYKSFRWFNFLFLRLNSVTKLLNQLTKEV